MNGIAFKVDDTLKMRDLRMAERSNGAAMQVMAKYAVDEKSGAEMPTEQFTEIVDGLTVAEFYQLYAEFVGASIPKASGRL